MYTRTIHQENVENVDMFDNKGVLTVETHSRTTDTETSKEAITAPKLSAQCKLVLGLVKQYPWDDFTAIEFSHWSHLDRHMVSRRLPDLMKLGHIERSPKGSKHPRKRNGERVWWKSGVQ